MLQTPVNEPDIRKTAGSGDLGLAGSPPPEEERPAGVMLLRGIPPARGRSFPLDPSQLPCSRTLTQHRTRLIPCLIRPIRLPKLPDYAGVLVFL